MLHGEENKDTIQAMSHLAITCISLGKFADVEQLQTKVLGLKNRLLGDEPPDTNIAMSSLANTYN